jgi:hypothetical protein
VPTRESRCHNSDSHKSAEVAIFRGPPNAFFRSRNGSPHIRAGKVRVIQLSERRIGIARTTMRRFLSPSRRLLVSAGPKSKPSRNNSEHGHFQPRCAGAAGDPWRVRKQEGLRTIERFDDLPVSRIEN